MTRRAKGEGSLLQIYGKKDPVTGEKKRLSENWYAQYYDADGRQRRVSTQTSVKQKALSILRRLMSDTDKGLVSIIDARKITYGDLRAGLLASYTEKGNRTLYTTADGAETIGGLKALDTFFGYDGKNPGPSAVRLTTDKAREFAKSQLAAGFSPATINRSLACLRRMLAISREDGKLQTLPVIRLLKEPAARTGFVTQKKFDELLAALPGHLRPLVCFLYWCGCRLGEARAIQWSQVDLQARLIRLEADQTKNQTARDIPLPSIVATALEEMTPKTGKVFDDANLRNEWMRACTAVGLGKMEQQESTEGNVWQKYSGLIIHDLRRSAIRNMVAAGNPEDWCMSISGHKTASVFRRYNIVSTANVTTAMQRVEEFSLKEISESVVKAKRNRHRVKRLKR
jgi:integrase